MNHNDPNHRQPPRAEPLQPDRPGRGDDKDESATRAPEASHQGETPAKAQKLKEQSDTAVENAREGYGG